MDLLDGFACDEDPLATCECRVQATSVCRVRAMRDRPLVLGLFAAVATLLDRWPTDNKAKFSQRLHL